MHDGLTKSRLSPRNQGPRGLKQPPVCEGQALRVAVDTCTFVAAVEATMTPSKLQARFPKGLHYSRTDSGAPLIVQSWLSGCGTHVATEFSFNEAGQPLLISSKIACLAEPTAQAALAESSKALRRRNRKLGFHHPTVVDGSRKRAASATVSWELGPHETISIKIRQWNVGAKNWSFAVQKSFKQPDASERHRRSSLDDLFY